MPQLRQSRGMIARCRIRLSLRKGNHVPAQIPHLSRDFALDPTLRVGCLDGLGPAKEMLGSSMSRIFALTMLITSSIMLAGCGYTPEQRGVSGAALGGATGAAIGAAAGHSAGAAVAGGVIGAATGAIVGANTAPPPPPPPPAVVYGAPPPPPPRCARFGYDAYGNRICIAYYGY
jgi:hypothetical protein